MTDWTNRRVVHAPMYIDVYMLHNERARQAAERVQNVNRYAFLDEAGNNLQHSKRSRSRERPRQTAA